MAQTASTATSALQARTNFQADDGAPLATLAQLTTFVRAAREDMLLKPWDAAVDLPEGSPALPELRDSADTEVAAAAKAVFDAMERLGGVLQSRYTGSSLTWLPRLALTD